MMKRLALLIIALLWSTPLAVPRVRRMEASGRAVKGPVNRARGDKSARLPDLHEEIEREISGQEIHSYLVRLNSRSYFRLTVEGRGVGLTLALIGPGGRGLAVSESRWHGRTSLSLVTKASGAYRLLVRAQERQQKKAQEEEQSAAAGSYRLRVEESRRATGEDHQRIAAERIVAQAEQLRSEWKTDSFERALRKYEEALRLWQSIGDKLEEARSLTLIGEVHDRMGARQKALDSYQLALPLSREVLDHATEIEVLDNIGYAYAYLGDNERAIDYCKQALQLSEAEADKRGEAQALNNLGEAYYNLSDEQKALGYSNRALDLSRELSDERGQAQALNNLGYTYYDLGETQKSFDYQQNQALPLWHALGDLRGEAETLTATGLIYSIMGEKQKALDFHNRAWRIFQTMGDRNGEARALNATGFAYFDAGEMSRALDIYTRALQISREIGYRQGEAIELGRLGDIYAFLGEREKALDYYQQELKLDQESKDQRTEAYALKRIGDLYFDEEKETALDYYQQALALSRSVTDKRGIVSALNGIGSLYEIRGETEQALNCYQEALPLSRAAQDRGREAQTLYHLAHLERDRGNLAEARSHIEASLGIIESLRTNLASEDLRSSYLASVHQHYELYTDLLMRLHEQNPSGGFAAAALQTSERGRARSLLELLAQAHANIRQGADALLLERERSLQQALKDQAERQMRLLNQEHTDEEAAGPAARIRELTNSYDEVESEIRTRSPHYARLTQPQPLMLSEIQNELDADTLLLEYSLGDERSYLWAVTPDAITGYTLPARALIETPARRVYDLLTARNRRIAGESIKERLNRWRQAEEDYPQAAAELSRMLLGPVSMLLGNKRIVVISDGALQYVPFAALPAPVMTNMGDKLVQESASTVSDDEMEPLMVGHEIVSLPSVSVLAVLRKELRERPPAAKQLAVFADPVFDKDDSRVWSRRRGRARRTSWPNTGQGISSHHASNGPASNSGPVSNPGAASDAERSINEWGLTDGGPVIGRLPFSRDEAKSILALVPARSRMRALDFQASLVKALDPQLSEYRIVHFATHGLLNSEHPELSGIVLSLVDEAGRPQEGFLQLHEIYNLNLPADLVVLSACQTGLGKEIKGEGLVGLTRGFMYAGAARVTASLWKVDDVATAELMRDFYRGMLGEGLRPASALRAAQVNMWRQKRWRSPYYWAAFVLQGEWK
ncbi:MAG TPA: CHAT domain-containing tetratricopeptide repeat protein [Pyrinomonadaceae bacterium]|jgi:CHAT domain-containing protein|nr:CHAT domain-containing tetratricopeptide repeat protein [Pyrinomonadaceae bacterium]